ncbi:hypothetical protein AVU18_gp058 [Citrobacter phage IME-CF2]|uniref:Uncharacterized protein n=1 Tax=Citrobacter phage IME-CF2 TaxID=1673887 RepID=A0A0K0QT34_9CAUD|nr:hypothetical protein AVU18_gp058 [Citrobacter phage IME-CF2]AKR15904.1 hypothetical protein [Citrobacter phage IME-CF2]
MLGLIIFYGTVIAVAIIIWYYVKKPGERSLPEYNDELEAWQLWDDQLNEHRSTIRAFDRRGYFDGAGHRDRL